MPAVTPERPARPAAGRPPRAPPRSSARSSPPFAAARPFEGEGFPVRRPFPGKLALSVTDPFLLLDQMGAVEYAPGEPKGTPWHPHRGFETVTYIIDGAFEHQDSTGGGGLIADGATQWMTAGVGPAAHRDPAGATRRQRRAVPRRPALGQPARGAEDDRSRATRTSRQARSGCSPARTAGRWYGSSPATWPVTRAPASPGPRSPTPTRRSRPAPSCRMPWRPDFNALVYVLSGPRLGRRREGTGEHGQPRRLRRRGRADGRRPTCSRTRRARRWRCCCSAGPRCASRSCTTARS